MTFFEPFEVEGVSFIYNRMDIIIMKAIPLTIAALSIVSYSASSAEDTTHIKLATTTSTSNR